jgi:hypothetical protein
MLFDEFSELGEPFLVSFFKGIKNLEFLPWRLVPSYFKLNCWSDHLRVASRSHKCIINCRFKWRLVWNLRWPSLCL